MNVNRSAFLRASAGAGIVAALPSAAFATPPAAMFRGDPEQKSIKVGLAVPDVAYWTLYVAASQGLWKNEGLDVQLVTFSGDASVAQALAGGSTDINAASLVGLLNMISSGQPVKAISAVANQAVFSFIGNSKIKTWSDLKGGTFGVASYGSMTAAMCTAALAQHGLVVDKDIQLVPTGGSPNAYAALEAGRLSGSGFSLPYALKSRTAGMNFLGSQVTVTGPQWPAELVYMKEDYIASHPRTISAFMRGLAVADKIIRTQPTVAIKSLQDAMKLEPDIAAGCYNIVKNTFLPRGQFPTDMSKVWKTLVVSKVVPAPVPMGKFYDPTWVANYALWMPR
jgi:NitT/TauT family transport system substrate-binding protein